MKRFATAALAAATLIAPLGAADTASADNGHHNGWSNHDNDRDHHWDRNRDRDNRYWDHRRYNGYWHNSQFYYGPPPVYYSDVRFDYRGWRRGERLPPYYASRYRQVDYRYYHVAPPPRGYRYVRDDDRGELLLVGITTGVILGAILANN